MGKAAKRAAPKSAASKPAAQPKKQRKASSNKDELPILSEAEKKKYKNQWENFRVVMWFYRFVNFIVTVTVSCFFGICFQLFFRE